jgi:NADH-quinone oxidoreductase subunit M
LAVLAIAGIIFTALYVLRLLANVLFGPRDEKFDKYTDMHGVEWMPLLLLGTVLVGFGLFPQVLMGVITSGVDPLLPLLQQLAAAPALLGGI